MADEAGGGGGTAPMVWALAVRATEAGPPFAELIVEIGPRLYGEFVESAVDSGFVLAAGEPPATTAVIGLRGAVLSRLVLVGGRQLWEPASEVRASPGWVAAAEGRGAVVVLVVPPGTWPPDLMDLDAERGAEALGRSLEAARTSGAVLHGTAGFARLGS
ncbi:hypothetical protein ACFVVL_26990 [Kitasatospora sp. NPDC058115]|uniref:hypothetical protein n=1 Tax=Kitasatospora sp. NPDC058115 TaxID=3346347 RepID=UPI0036DF381E